ncbi:hypothetical protein ACNKHR_11345 [Shigella flexneri]
MMETKIDIHLINKKGLKRHQLKHCFIFIGSSFYFEVDYKKRPPLAMVRFLADMRPYASLQQAANDYFLAAKRAAASSQFTTFQNALM